MESDNEHDNNDDDDNKKKGLRFRLGLGFGFDPPLTTRLSRVRLWQGLELGYCSYI